MDSSVVSSTLLTTEEFLARLAGDATRLSVLASSSPLLCVDLHDWQHSNEADVPTALPACPIIGVQSGSHEQPKVALPDFVDAVVECDSELAQIQAVVNKRPHAATVFVQLLRNSAGLSVAQGLFVESLAYSTLQHGAEFADWLGQQDGAGASKSSLTEDLSEPAVQVTRQADRLLLSLNRPGRKNAFSAAMRDLLCEALELAVLDESIIEITLAGTGSAFCAGGDLSEFGHARDAAIAHLSRTTRSAGALLHRLSNRVRVRVHGACIGAGIELPAFASRVEARRDSFFVLPEVALGLVPGAGGCISLPRRIGRHRTAFMGLSGARIDAQRALDWGLVDELVSD